MLREVFRTAPLQYHTMKSWGGQFGIFGRYNEQIPLPNIEAISSVTGLFVHNTIQTVLSDHNIFVWMILTAGWCYARTARSHC